MTRGVSVALTMATLTACYAPEEPAAEPVSASSEEPERCILDPSQGSEPRDVEIGVMVGGYFMGYEDGDRVELEWGSQGGVMITPIVRVAAASGDPERVCLEVKLDNELVGTAAQADFNAGMKIQTWLRRENGVFSSRSLDHLLAYDATPLDEASLRLTASVDGLLEGTREVTIVLVSP